LDRARALGPVLLVDTGNVFSSPYVWTGPRKRREAFLSRVYRSWGYRAVALGWGDYPALQRGMGRGLPWVSANVRAPGVRPFRVVGVGPWKVAVTAITGKGSYALAMDWRRPKGALKEVLKRIPGDVDVVVLLLSSPARGGKLPLERVDVVLGGVRGRRANKRQGPPYIFRLRVPRGGEALMVTLEKTSQGVRLASFKAYVLNSKVPGDPRVAGEIRAIVR